MSGWRREQDQRTSAGHEHVLFVKDDDPFTAMYRRYKIGNPCPDVQQLFRGETAHQDAERRMMDALIAEVHVEGGYCYG